MIEQINQLKQGSVISESSHYIVNKVLQMQQRIL